MGYNQSTGEYYLNRLEDPDNVDKRRAEIGLEPIADYLKRWDLEWDVAKFKMEQAEREKEKENR